MDSNGHIGICHVTFEHAHLCLDVGDRNGQVTEFTLDLQSDRLILRLVILLHITLIFRFVDLQIILQRTVSGRHIIYAGILRTQCSDTFCRGNERLIVSRRDADRRCIVIILIFFVDNVSSVSVISVRLGFSFDKTMELCDLRFQRRQGFLEIQRVDRHRAAIYQHLFRCIDIHILAIRRCGRICPLIHLIRCFRFDISIVHREIILIICHRRLVCGITVHLFIAIIFSELFNSVIMLSGRFLLRIR